MWTVGTQSTENELDCMSKMDRSYYTSEPLHFMEIGSSVKNQILFHQAQRQRKEMRWRQGRHCSHSTEKWCKLMQENHGMSLGN